MADPTITTPLIDRYVTRSAFEVFLLNLLVEEDGGLLDANDPALDAAKIRESGGETEAGHE